MKEKMKRCKNKKLITNAFFCDGNNYDKFVKREPSMEISILKL